jgi:hypothetical protein
MTRAAPTIPNATTMHATMTSRRRRRDRGDDSTADASVATPASADSTEVDDVGTVDEREDA